jgi:hypothetical protein
MTEIPNLLSPPPKRGGMKMSWIKDQEKGRKAVNVMCKLRELTDKYLAASDNLLQTSV